MLDILQHYPYDWQYGANLTFVQQSNTAAVAQHYLGLKALHRKTMKIEYRGYPYLETGDIVAFNAGNMDTQPFIVTKNALRLAGGMTETLEARERS